jgi:hypothetical protein
LTCLRVLLHLRPQPLVGGSDLPGNVAGHLGRQAKLDPYLIVVVCLQAFAIASLVVGKGVLTHVVQSVSVGQLGLA